MLSRFKPKPLSGRERARKAAKITGLVHQKTPPELDTLRSLALEDGGFLSSQIRSSVWPAILNVSASRISGHLPNRPQDHRDKRQVQLDVNRSLSHFGLSDSEREKLLPTLTYVVDSILASHSELYYYQGQGFNDVCSIVVCVMKNNMDPYPVCERLALYFFREAMNRSLNSVQLALKLIMRVVQRQDKKLYECLAECDMEPIYAISWLLTWFAHNIKSLAQASRVYDFLLASHPLMSVYLAAAAIQARREPLLRTRGDYSAVHDIMQRAFEGKSMWRDYPYPFLRPEFQTIQDLHAVLGSSHQEMLATEQSLYYWRPWAKTQDKGYMDGYMKVLWWDHSFSYENSNFQNPLAEGKQEEPKDGYKYNYNFLYPAKKKDQVKDI